MDPLTWAMLIARVGVPIAEALLKRTADQTPVTIEEWTALKERIGVSWDDIPAVKA